MNTIDLHPEGETYIGQIDYVPLARKIASGVKKFFSENLERKLGNEGMHTTQDNYATNVAYR